jgi:uncharacterized membrane-anchored protein
MTFDFNAELHARPSIYFAGPAFIEHIALMPEEYPIPTCGHRFVEEGAATDGDVRTQIEFHTEFVTVTRVTRLAEEPQIWPAAPLTAHAASALAALDGARAICRTSILVCGPAPDGLDQVLSRLGFADTAASAVGGGSAQACSDFRVAADGSSRVILFNKDLNAYRLGRMVRRLYEIETYRSMALLALPEARRLAPLLSDYDANLMDLTNRNLTTPSTRHKELMDEISQLSAHAISAAAGTRNRFGATAAYAKIVEDRIGELRETHVPGFQRYGVFIVRRFRPAIRTCEATALRLERLSNATTHMIDLLQTRIQVEIEYQNATQIQAMAERAATQVKIQRAVEGLSIIAISYCLLGLLKIAFKAADHAGYHVSSIVMLVSIPIVIGAVSIAILRVRHAIQSSDR